MIAVRSVYSSMSTLPMVTKFDKDNTFVPKPLLWTKKGAAPVLAVAGVWGVTCQRQD